MKNKTKTASDFQPKKNASLQHKIEPDSLSSPNANNGHSRGQMAEHEELDPTISDAEDLKTKYPGEDEKKRKITK